MLNFCCMEIIHFYRRRLQKTIIGFWKFAIQVGTPEHDEVYPVVKANGKYESVILRVKVPLELLPRSVFSSSVDFERLTKRVILFGSGAYLQIYKLIFVPI